MNKFLFLNQEFLKNLFPFEVSKNFNDNINLYSSFIVLNIGRGKRTGPIGVPYSKMNYTLCLVVPILDSHSKFNGGGSIPSYTIA